MHTATRHWNKTMLFVRLPDGAQLPFATQPSPLNLVVGHGLGSNPAEKSHSNDISADLWNDTLKYLKAKYSVSMDKTAILYTARGHGEAQPPVDASLPHESAYTWPALARDMLHVADSCGLANEKFVILGQSMGAATGLYLTLAHPQRVNGIILARPPRAWEARAQVASMFQQEARALQSTLPQGSDRHLPLLGAAITDLPPRQDKELYGSLQCPTLILSHGEDDAHPIETGKFLSELIRQATFKTVTNEVEACKQWPEIMADWLVLEGLVQVPN